MLRGGVGYHRRSRCLEGELDTTAGADECSDNSGGGRHARYLTPPLRLEGAGGALNSPSKIKVGAGGR